MQRIYEIQFTAYLQKMNLAFKMECQIQAFWKRGSKVAETGKVPFRNCLAQFNKQLKISCNMTFNTEKKIFLQKKTKFQIVIYTQKGNKNAGQVILDVAPFLNQRNKTKNYQLQLQSCPDKNAKLCLSLKATIIGQKSFDTISRDSQFSVDIHNLPSKDSKAAGQSQISNKILQNTTNENSIPISMSKNKQKQMVPTTDRSMKTKTRRQQPENVNIPQNQKSDSKTPQMIKQLESQNKKLKQQLKNKQKIIKQNQQLKRRLKDDDYQSCKQYKKKIQQAKKQIQNLNNQSKGVKKINEDIKNLQRNILKTKQQIMRIVNQADKYGTDVMEKIQQACGLKQY